MGEQFGFGGEDGGENEPGGVIRENMDIEEPGDSFTTWFGYESIEWMAAGGDYKLKKRLQNFNVLDVWIMYYTNKVRRMM